MYASSVKCTVLLVSLVLLSLVESLDRESPLRPAIKDPLTSLQEAWKTHHFNSLGFGVWV